MELEQLAKMLVRYERAKTMTDPTRYASTPGHQALSPDLYQLIPPPSDGKPPSKEDIDRKMVEKAEQQRLIVELLAGERVDDSAMRKHFGFGMEALKSCLDNLFPIKKPIPEKLVVLTFDDSTRDHIENAAPVLRELGFSATFFTTEMCDPHIGADFRDKRRFMYWDEIKKLFDMGFEIGNHTHHHKFDPRGDTYDEEDFLREVDGLDELCLAHGIPKPISFAYPGGGATSAMVRAVHSRGFHWARGDLRSGVCASCGTSTYDPAVDCPLATPSYGNAPGFTYAGLDQRVSEAKNGRVVVLAYHIINNPKEWGGEGSWELQMRHLKDMGYRGISYSQLEEYVDASKAYLRNFD